MSRELGEISSTGCVTLPTLLELHYVFPKMEPGTSPLPSILPTLFLSLQETERPGLKL